MKQLVKIVLAIVLAMCIFKMPYGYYQFVRLSGCIGLIWLTYEYGKSLLAIPCILSAILLNPIIKIHFDRDTWNIIDVIIAIALVIWVIVDLVSLYHAKRKKDI